MIALFACAVDCFQLLETGKEVEHFEPELNKDVYLQLCVALSTCRGSESGRLELA